MKVDVQLSQSVIGAATRVKELEALGVDGVFSFENAHDLFKASDDLIAVFTAALKAAST